MTNDKHTVIPVKIDKGVFNPESAPKAAQELWDRATGSLQSKLAFDAKWGGAHPHALCVWDDEVTPAEQVEEEK